MGNREYHYLPWENYLQVAEGAGKKVAPDGKLLPFYGSTVIFDLNDSTKAQLKRLQDKLYARCGHFLSEPLVEDSFHMTLHDLVSGTDRGEVQCRMNEVASCAKQTVEDVKRLLDLSTHLRPTKLVSMVSTSVVLLLEPTSDVGRFLLNSAYDKLQSVVHLNYGLTPHITLGYYRPGVISGEDLQTLADTLSWLSDELDFPVVLKHYDLHYREFYDMNHYVEQL